MERNLTALTDTVFDLCIVGGGIYGAALAWEAAQRGLSVALLEQHDFGGATSANSLKTIHGGLRYLQHADIKRMRESVHERAALMRIAPHLVHPLPCLLPTKGHGMKGREMLTLGLLANDILSFDQNRSPDPQKCIPRGRIISREECLQLLPDVDPRGISGGAIFYDAQVHNSERLVIAFLHSAVAAGARIANYAAAVGLAQHKGRITGVEVEDQLGTGRFIVQARTVINTSGPWINELVRDCGGRDSWPEQRFATAINVITRPLFGNYAVGISSKITYHDQDALLRTGSRFLFISPWRGYSMVGTAYYPYTGHPDQFAVTDEDLANFIDEINQTYPAAKLSLDDIRFVHGGLVLSSGVDPKTNSVQLAKHYYVHDHARDGVEGLISVVGIKYTTARDVAEKIVNMLAKRNNWRVRRSATARIRLHGGNIPQFSDFLQNELRRRPYGLSDEIVRGLVYNYGTAYLDVLKHSHSIAMPSGPAAEQSLALTAETLYAVRKEMALHLTDVVLRRTELGSAGYPGDLAIATCATVMGAELGWDNAQKQREIEAVRAVFRGRYGTDHHNSHLADSPVQALGVEAAQI